MLFFVLVFELRQKFITQNQDKSGKLFVVLFALPCEYSCLPGSHFVSLPEEPFNMWQQKHTEGGFFAQAHLHTLDK